MLWADRFDFEMLDGTQLNPNTYEIRNLPYAGPGYFTVDIFCPRAAGHTG